MTNADLAAARARVEQRQRDLDDARTALADVEHDAYGEALQLIADEVAHAAQAKDATGLADALSNIGGLLSDLGVQPRRPQATAAGR